MVRIYTEESRKLKRLARSRVIPRIVGGLGNQLFIYAAARRLAHVSGAELVLDSVSGFQRDAYGRSYVLDQFNIPTRKATALERLEPFSRARRYILRRWNKRLPFAQRKYIVQEGMDFDERLLHLRPHGTVRLEGYWQSEQYFRDVGPLLRKELAVKQPRDDANHVVSRQIRGCTAVAVHVRFFDEPGTEGLNNAPSGYYARAVHQMEQLVPGAHYFVFSDRPGEARRRLPLSDDRVTIVGHNDGDENAYADLWLMTQCDHFIIANSTFSWWGAWLSPNELKHVIAPGREIPQGKTAWGFRGLLPESWIQL
jgi:hypothetical protein